MKRLWSFAIGALVVGVGLAGRSEPATGRSSHKPKLTTVAVLPYTLPQRSDLPDSLGQTLVDAMNSALHHSGRFRVVDRAMLGPLLDQIRFDSHGFVDPESAKRVGHLASADVVIYGDVQGVTPQWDRKHHRVMSVEVVVHHTATWVESGEMWKTESSPGRASNDILSSDDLAGLCAKAFEGSAQQFVSGLIGGEDGPVQGRVIEKVDKDVSINLGRGQVSPGMYVLFYRADTTHQVPKDEQVMHTHSTKGKAGEPLPCVGRVLGDQIQDNGCYVEVGCFQTERFGLFGSKIFKRTVFKSCADSLAAVHVGDIARLSPSGTEPE